MDTNRSVVPGPRGGGTQVGWGLEAFQMTLSRAQQKPSVTDGDNVGRGGDVAPNKYGRRLSVSLSLSSSSAMLAVDSGGVAVAAGAAMSACRVG